MGHLHEKIRAFLDRHGVPTIILDGLDAIEHDAGEALVQFALAGEEGLRAYIASKTPTEIIRKTSSTPDTKGKR